MEILLDEMMLFYQGYGSINISYIFLAYYRFYRIIQDVVE